MTSWLSNCNGKSFQDFYLELEINFFNKNLSKNLSSDKKELKEIIEHIIANHIEDCDKVFDLALQKFAKHGLREHWIELGFNFYLDYPQLSGKWNNLELLEPMQQIDFIYRLFKSDEDIIEKFKRREISEEYYTNEKRLGKSALNFKERSLLLMLYADSRTRKKRLAILDFALSQFQHLEIDEQKMKEKINLSSCYPQNFNLLPLTVKEILNKAYFPTLVYKTIYSLTMEDAIAYHALNIASKSILSRGHTVYDQYGKHIQGGMKEMIEAYSRNQGIDNLKIDFLTMKSEYAKSKQNKTLWLKVIMDIELAPKEITMKKSKI